MHFRSNMNATRNGMHAKFECPNFEYKEGDPKTRHRFWPCRAARPAKRQARFAAKIWLYINELDGLDPKLNFSY
jgi:hypothetical protein